MPGRNWVAETEGGGLPAQSVMESWILGLLVDLGINFAMQMRGFASAGHRVAGTSPAIACFRSGW